MAKVTKIKAREDVEPEEKPKKAVAEKAAVKTETTKAAKVGKSVKPETAEMKAKKAEKPGKKPFILWRPLVYLGRYLRDSWREIRQVHWPNRKTTWKMVLAVLVYTAIFMIFISLLDLLFSWLAGLVFGNK